MFQARLVGVIKTIVREVGVPDAALVTEARGLRVADRSRPGDVVALDFLADGRHLVIYRRSNDDGVQGHCAGEGSHGPGVRGKTSRRQEVFG